MNTENFYGWLLGLSADIDALLGAGQCREGCKLALQGRCQDLPALTTRLNMTLSSRELTIGELLFSRFANGNDVIACEQTHTWDLLGDLGSVAVEILYAVQPEHQMNLKEFVRFLELFKGDADTLLRCS